MRIDAGWGTNVGESEGSGMKRCQVSKEGTFIHVSHASWTWWLIDILPTCFVLVLGHISNRILDYSRNGVIWISTRNDDFGIICPGGAAQKSPNSEDWPFAMRSKKSETPEGQELFAAVDVSWIVLANGIQGLFLLPNRNIYGNIVPQKSYSWFLCLHLNWLFRLSEVSFSGWPVGQGFGTFSQTDP